MDATGLEGVALLLMSEDVEKADADRTSLILQFRPVGIQRSGGPLTCVTPYAYQTVRAVPCRRCPVGELVPHVGSIRYTYCCARYYGYYSWAQRSGIVDAMAKVLSQSDRYGLE